MRIFIIILIALLGFSSCLTHKCYRGVFSTPDFVELDEKWIGKIVDNDTIYKNENIVLTKTEIICSKNRTRQMKVIWETDSQLASLIPSESYYQDDSMLYINAQFFISPLETGIIVATQKEGHETHFFYPKDEYLWGMTKELKKIGIYRFEDGEFKYLTESVSKSTFKEICTNDTCYIPYPGILYDKNINLNTIETINGL